MPVSTDYRGHICFCFAASEGGAEQGILDCVKEAVLALKPRGRTHVRAMCDMLLRCAATHFFDQQVLPARSKPEVSVLYRAFVREPI
jgi:hypothetical protein